MIRERGSGKKVKPLMFVPYLVKTRSFTTVYGARNSRSGFLKQNPDLLTEETIQVLTDFLENRCLFRRKTPSRSTLSSSDTQKTCSTSSQIKQTHSNTSAWHRCINRLRVFYKEFILKISPIKN